MALVQESPVYLDLERSLERAVGQIGIADGRILNNHRKLMLTNPERMVWGSTTGPG